MRRSPGFDPQRTSIFVSNHVNIFDPFVVYSAIPQFFRGFELESHFKIPIYGWMMGRFGNVPVPDAPTRESLEIMTQRSKKALDSGISLIAFAEGSRTRDGHVQPFKKGIFNLAQKFGVPIVPVSIVGSYQFFQTGNWMLYPGKITVYLHDTIDTSKVSTRGRGRTAPARAGYRCGARGGISEKLEASKRLRNACLGKRAAGAKFLPGVDNAVNHGDRRNRCDHPKHLRHAIEHSA